MTNYTYDVSTNGETTSPRWGYVSNYTSYTPYTSISFIEEKIEEMLKRLAPPEYTELKCRECGGTIEQGWNDHIVKCPYCKTVYVIGRKMLNG